MFLDCHIFLAILSGVPGLHHQGDGQAKEGLHEDLCPTSVAQHQVQGGLLDVVIKYCDLFHLFARSTSAVIVGHLQ